MSKAFDTLDRQVILEKLIYFGIDEATQSWFSSYLSVRSQYVSVNDKCSSFISVELGVAHGSGLPPFLFIIFVNNFVKCSSILNFLYADDSTLYFTSSNLQSLFEFVNYELQNATKWLHTNKLTVNSGKSN